MMTYKKTVAIVLLLAISAIPATTFADSLVAHWKLDEISGVTAFDDTANNNDGTLHNMNDSDWVAGCIGNALDFDGSDDYVTVADNSALNFGTGSFSISFWAKSAMSSEKILIIKGTSGGEYTGASGKRYSIRYHNGAMYFVVDDNVTKSYLYGNTGYGTNDWLHIVAVRDRTADQMLLYRDTDLDVSTPDSTDNSIDSTADELLFGAEIETATTYKNFADTALDDIRFYDYALTQTEIDNLHRTDVNVAYGPSPYDGESGVDETSVTLSWTAGDNAVTHEVYFGTSQSLVSSRNASVYEGSFGSPSHSVGTLNEGTVYYWAVDEVNGSHSDSPWPGEVWSFTTAFGAGTLSTSPSGHYVTYNGQNIMLIGDSGTQCPAQNSNLDHREWIDDCYDRGIRAVHVWAFIAARQKQDLSVIEDRWGYLYPDITPWARNTSGPLALDQKYQWNLQAWDEGAEGDFTHYWPRMRDMASYAKSKNMILGVTILTGWAKPGQDPWEYHPFKTTNGGHLTNASDAVIIDTPGTEIYTQTWSEVWSNAKKTQWLWEQLCIKLINDLGSMGNVFFVFFDEHSYDDGNGEIHFADMFRSRGMAWMDENDYRSSFDWIMSGTFGGDDKNSAATSGFMATPAKPYFFLEGHPYMGDGVREAIWTFSTGGGHYFFHGDYDQETITTGIMGYDPYVPGGDKGMYKRDWLGYASRFFNEHLEDLDSMSPWNSLVGSGAYCLANNGSEYAVYSMSGYSTITVDLSSASGKTLDCYFYDPRDGISESTFQRTGGSSSESFTKPSSDDWALHIAEPSSGFTTDNLVALLTFGEGSGSTSADITGNGHTATLTSTSWGAGYVTVPTSPDSARISVASGSQMQGQSFTWDIWVEAEASTIHGRIAAQTDSVGGTGPEIIGTGGTDIGIRINNDGTIFDVPTIGTRSNSAPPDHWAIPLEDFHRNSGSEHMVLVHDAATKTVRFFIGLKGSELKLSFEGTYTGSYAVGSVPLVIGNNPALNRIFAEKCFQFAYYDRPLTFTVDGSRNVTEGEIYNNHLAGDDVSLGSMPPTITEVSPDPQTIYTGTEYTKQLELQQGSLPITWSVVQGPTGLQVNSSGYVYGWTPGGCDVGDSITIEIQALNAQGSDTETWQVEPEDYYLEDGFLDFNDLAVMADEWLNTGAGLAADLDCTSNVDFLDYAILADEYGSTEEPPPPDLVISSLSPGSYQVVYDALNVGQLLYVDRTVEYASVPSAYQAKTFIKTANDDKHETGSSFMSFDINRDASVYVAHDDRLSTKPGWLTTDFTDTGDDLVDDSGESVHLSLYKKDFTTGTVTLGGNEGGGQPNCSMYTVVVVEQ